ncbi:MAG: autotransporter-associated beta strand repeat-containing protein [Bacteroidaceae bacterium]|nr:autotransporter-associated beta strand repeat-containing protein [Bacteroidaceae bacterium]
MKKYLLLAVTLLLSLSASAQRVTDKLDRGLVAMPGTSGGNFVSWRIFGEEYYDVTYNLYRNGSKIASKLKVSNYTDTGGSSTSVYQVAPVVRGVEQEKCPEVKRWANQYLDVPVQGITDRNGKDATSDYQLNDVSLADLNGDGISEFIVKRPCSVAADVSQKARFHVVDCYDIDGNRLWWIDMGPNMLSGADEQWDVVAYDWDLDGKAEVLLRGQDNMIIHHADGTTTNIGSMTVDTRWNGIEYTSSGNEYLLYLNGETAQVYSNIPYPLTRGNDIDWGEGIAGHRSTKHYFGAPFFDGRRASIFLGRGAYTKHKMAAYDVDPATHALTQRWYWECNVGGPWFGQGYHNYAIADVDEDGRDEVVFGSMVIDDNGKGLSTTGLGHGDAQHCGDFDPYRKGLEQYTCNESSPNMNYRNATTSAFYYRNVGGSDDGRGLMANFTNTYPGSVGRSVNTGMVSSVKDKIIGELGTFIDWSDLSFRFYWDGDLCDEVLDSPGSEAREFKIEKPGQGRLLTTSGCATCNSSKNNPCATGDIFGDWREELVARTYDNTKLRIYVSPHSSKYGIYTLWHDHQYRQAMVWQSMGYNQPPHKSYFLGEMEGITVAPPPLTMAGRTEIPNGGTIMNEDKHFLVCEPNDTKITIADGASPYIVTFNVPSHVEGTAGSNCTEKETEILYTYYKCDVTGGALTGNTRLVKQGDGILNLPAVEMTYTGATNVWAGVLNFDGKLPNSTLWLNRFAELNSAGTFRSIKAQYGAVVRPGGDGMGTLTTDSLVLGFGSRVQLDLYSEGLQCDGLNVKYLSVERKTGTVWESYGPQYLMPVIEIVAHKGAGAEKLKAGDYTLGLAPELLKGSLADIRIEGISGQATQLSVKDGQLVLTVRDIRAADVVYWTGEESSDWDYAATENFQNSAGDKDIFVTGDQVVFDDAASVSTVNLKQDLDPREVVVRGKKNFTFSGAGAIVGSANLVKEGTGTLTLQNDNTFTGGVRLSGGVTKVASLSNAYQSYGALGNPGDAAGLFVMENGAELNTTAAVQTNTPIKLQTAEGGVLNNASDFAMNAAFSGTRLTKKGAGWLKLYADNGALDTLTVEAGVLQSNVATPAKVLELKGGSVDLNQGSNVAVHVPKGKTSVLNCFADRGVYGNRLMGAGKVTIYYPLVKGSGWYAERASFNGNWSAFEGTVVVSGVAADGRFCLNNSNGMPKGTLEIPEGFIVQNTGKSFALGQVTGKGTLGGVCTLGGSAGSANTWTVGNDGNFTFEGCIADASNFVKTGTGKMTHKGTGTLTGTVKVSAGELCLNNATTNVTLGTGALTVAKGATLSGKGVLANSTVTVSSGATLRSGITETNALGKLDFSEKNVTVNGVIQTYVSTKKSFSKFVGINKLRINGTLVVKGEDLSLAEGDELQIFDAASITLGSDVQYDLCSPNAALGLTWDASRLDEGLLVVGPAPVAVVSIHDEQLDRAEIYTLGGQRLPSRPQRPGIYIVNGQKTLLK